jgi:flagellar protein FliO/FliZ
MIDYFTFFIKIIVSLVFILCLILLAFKYGGGKLQLLQNRKYLKIIEKVSLSKENSILVMKMGSKAYVVASSQNKIDILREVPEEELKNLEDITPIPKNDKLLDLIKNWRKKEE